MTMLDRYLSTVAYQIPAMHEWIDEQEKKFNLPIYSSVDVRDSGFKLGIVDTNLFPAGFNNLSSAQHSLISTQFRKAILKKDPTIRTIAIIAEDHTRNKRYLHHLFILRQLIENAGFSVILTSFFEGISHDLESENNHVLTIYGLQHLLHASSHAIDLLICNNDLTSGLPPLLKNLSIPCIPNPQLGWFNRSKIRHFEYANQWISTWANQFGLDPWLFSCLMKHSSDLSINTSEDRHVLADLASDLLKEITEKYKAYGISQQPTLFLKAANGTYGMGVEVVTSADDIALLNRKSRNNLSKGKGSSHISSFLIQEGISTIHHFDNHVAEPCLYLINNQVVGGFYRLNNQKNTTQNLNSPGMSFAPIETGTAFAYPSRYEWYGVLSRLAGLAASEEEKELA